MRRSRLVGRMGAGALLMVALLAFYGPAFAQTATTTTAPETTTTTTAPGATTSTTEPPTPYGAFLDGNPELLPLTGQSAAAPQNSLLSPFQQMPLWMQAALVSGAFAVLALVGGGVIRKAAETLLARYEP